MAHAGEALDQRQAFERLTKVEQDALIEFLKSFVQDLMTRIFPRVLVWSECSLDPYGSGQNCCV